MSRNQRFEQFGSVLLACSLLLFAVGCGKKKTPPPPPPPPPQQNTAMNNPPPPPPPVMKPVINSFSAEPSRIDRGQSATLRWSVSNATDITIDQGVGAVQSQGSRQVYPGTTVTYTLIANGPSGSDTRTATIEVASGPPPPPVSNTPTLSAAETLSRETQDAYFDYNSNDIRADANQALTTDAEVLKRIFGRDPNFTVVIEGHCDERGSAEYNLGLGDRRATAAKEFLVQLGVPADRLKTLSYGKERQQCTDATEECYQKNRRAHLVAGQ